MDTIDQNEVAKKYNSLDAIWNKEDKWHWSTHQIIGRFITAIYRKIRPTPEKILNAGSGGNSYDMPTSLITHMDIAEKRLSHCENKIIGTIENIPRPAGSFDLIVCVGSVLNYCDPVKTINEFSRVATETGSLLIEFESSKTLELIGTKGYNKKMFLTDTFYNEQQERLWYYSESLIIDLLKENRYKIIAIKRFHILSPFIYRLTKNQNIAASFRWLDGLMRLIPFVRKNSSNILLFAQKKVK